VGRGSTVMGGDAVAERPGGAVRLGNAARDRGRGLRVEVRLPAEQGVRAPM
jgi:hypothetical protein